LLKPAATLSNAALSVVPMVVIAAMVPIVMIAPIRAYSMAVAPLSFRANAFR